MVNSRFRFLIIRIAVFSMMLLLIFRLFELQITEKEKYGSITRERVGVNLIKKAPRGQIYDRYGTPLVVNRSGYSLKLISSDMDENELNLALFKLAELVEDTDNIIQDSFPVSRYPFKFTFKNEEEKEKWFSENKHSKIIKPDMSAKEVMEAYANEIYKIPQNASRNQKRIITGIRYEAENSGFSATNPLLIAEDINVELVSGIKERQHEFPCLMVADTYYREYKNGMYASHILGRTGKLTQEEYEKYKDEGYRYDDIIGKQGIEKAAEKYLRGTDGTNGIVQDVNGEAVTVVEKVPAESGSSIVLTIDLNLQKVLEDSLAKTIKTISENGGEKTGADANAGAAVVLDVKNGDVLALASYPTYDLSRFNKDYSMLSENEAKPLWNRAVSGTYMPGSTFKPLVAIAALETESIGRDELITDEGIYTYYEDYQPKCWIWQEHNLTHGSLDVSSAIEESCNYFFYEAGRRTGIEKIADYASKFGLGEFTGIELPEEVEGSVAKPEYKQKMVKDKSEKSWFGADTLQASIGQSYHAITPVQLANYVATIANDGKRNDVNIIKSVRNPGDNSVVTESENVVSEKINISEENLNAVKEGMKNVVDEGSAQSIFKDYPIKIGGKTGTAQIGKNVSNNAFFVAYAPFDNPEIAICVVIEHGVRGANAAYVARDLFDYYFEVNKTEEIKKDES